MQLYFIDSMNLEQLNAEDKEIPKLYIAKVKERALAGLKVADKFTMKMNV